MSTLNDDTDGADVDGSDDGAVTDADDEPVVELDDVTVEYEDPPLVEDILPESILERFGLTEEPVRAVDDVSLEVEEEDVVVLIGESGSGKTTLGRTAVGLEDPTSGSVRYRGYDTEAAERGEYGQEMLHEDVQRNLQIIHQDADAALNPYRTIRSQLAEPLKLWYPDLDLRDRTERILQMLRTVGVQPAEEYMDRYPHELSGGEKQRVTIIRAMMLEPDLIVADEVVGALDVSLRVDIMNLLLDLQDMFGTSFLFVSHNLTNARFMAKKADGRIAVMYLGRIVEIGPVDEVLNNPQHPYTQILRWASLPLDPDDARKTITEESPVMTNEAPDPQDIPTGCRFQDACPKAREACLEEDPELFETDDDRHQVACLRSLDDHEYWDSESIHDEEREIPQ
jgi:peptide/nickel transport system ATP-binding protein